MIKINPLDKFDDEINELRFEWCILADKIELIYKRGRMSHTDDWFFGKELEDLEQKEKVTYLKIKQKTYERELFFVNLELENIRMRENIRNLRRLKREKENGHKN